MTLLTCCGSRRVRIVALLGLLAILAGVALWLYHDKWGLPKPGSKRYEDYVVAFQVGTAAMDAGALFQPRAEEAFTQAIALIPEEPAAWANRGLLYVRMDQLDQAGSDLERASTLAPGQPDIEESLGLLAERRGKLDQAIAHLEKSVAADPGRPARLYSLYRLAQASGGEDGDAKRAEYLERLLLLRPTSLLILMDRARLAARRSDMATLRDTFARLEKMSSAWKPANAKRLAYLRAEAETKPDPIDFMNGLQQLKNVMAEEPGYQRSSGELQAVDNTLTGVPLQQLVKLAPVHFGADVPDHDLTFDLDSLNSTFPGDVFKSPWQQVVPAWLGRTDRPALFVASASEVRRLDGDQPRMPFPGGNKAVPPSMDGVLSFDWNDDFRNDFLLAGAGGLKFYQQQKNGTFSDVTKDTKLPQAILQGDYYGAWAVDIDQDGDLDVILARRNGSVILLRNNGNGTFKDVPFFPGVVDLRGFAWLDLDNDGAADAVLLDARGRMHVFMNERSAQFRRREAPAPSDRFQALCVADVNDDGVLDLIALRTDGAVVRYSDQEKGTLWDSSELARLSEPSSAVPGECRLSAYDLDNNGAIDLVFRTSSTGFAWLADGKGQFTALAAVVPPGLTEIFSLEEGGQFDFWGIDFAKESQILRSVTRSNKGYRWRTIRPRSNPLATGDKRVNSFAIGSEAEIRSGSLVIKQPVTRPVVHFGLGSRKATPVIRIVWTNGTSQNEFTNPLGAVIVVEQRLSGSCPFLFSWDGEKMVFVSDFLWSSPLGMFINGQEKREGGGVPQTTDWTRIRSDHLVPRNGNYDLRVNANLWETHFIDHLALMVVDHPPGSEMFVDERFFLTPTSPRLYLTEKPRPVKKALDHKGNDVTDIVRHIDGNYLDRAGRGDYQGVTHDHWVTIDLGDDAPTEGPVYLLAHGFIHPTDSSINFALEQNPQVRPQPLSLEVPDGKGGWKVGLSALGFPAGKNKTIVLRLDGIEGKGVSRRVRLRTNMEIHWDAIWYARGLDADACKKTTLIADKANLSHRGIVRMSQAGPGTPELPHYDDVVSTRPVWRDLTGFHTRFGDVKELLEKIDDRYVIMNAGDELRLQFKVPPPPLSGWKRDFVWNADGWEKDGNLNTRFSKTVLPLPYHGMADYLTPPGRLEADPVYKRFPGDWLKYHTRYVTPAHFEQGLRSFRRPSR